MIKYFSPCFPFLICWALLLATPLFFEISLVNGVAQLVLFGLVVCWPAWKTGRMSYVDIGWPWGLVVIGLVTYLMSDGDPVRTITITLVYVFVGARMGLGALKLWRLGHLATELPRYRYQRLRWERSGKTNQALAMQVEALIQGLANASFLALPAFIIGTNSNPDISVLEILGLSLWLVAYSIETIADAQKLKFLKAMKRAGERNRVCTIGLWRYSRHPNYFAEWLVWTAMVIATIPSWFALYDRVHVVAWLLLGLALLFVSRLMYVTLVFYSGAVPSEYYSVKKRPEYSQYQSQTNRFFPGPMKK